jgi:tetrathionate reductase subunit B
MKTFLIDLSICNGCYNCQVVCKDEHVENDWTPIAKPQPDTGQFWCKLNECVRGTVPKVKVSYVPVMCQLCNKPSCMDACSIEGAIYRRNDGLIIIDPVKCTGCQKCVNACSYGAIYFNNKLNIAQKCTGCAHLLDSGWKEPRCVDACPTGALKFGEESEFSSLNQKTEILHPEFELDPRVHYIGLAKKFIAGTVYDPVNEEVVKGARCTLRDKKDSFITTTDNFGDFWFDGLKTNTFSLSIEAAAKTKIIDHISTDKDINLGDIAL